MFGFKIFQVRVQHLKEKIDIGARLRDFEHTNVCFLARTGICASRTCLRKMPVRLGLRKSDRECELARDQINTA